MRKFTDTHRLQALSDADLVERWEEVALKATRRHRFAGKKLRQGTLLNAVALAFAALPDGERDRFAAKVLRELEMFLAETDEEREQAEQQPEPAKPEAGQPPKRKAPKLGNPRRTTERDKRADQEYRSGGKKGGKRSAGDSADSKDKGTDREDLVPSGR